MIYLHSDLARQNSATNSLLKVERGILILRDQDMKMAAQEMRTS